MSQETLIIKGKPETEGSGEHVLFEHSGAKGLETAEAEMAIEAEAALCFGTC